MRKSRDRTHHYGCWIEHEECSPPGRIWLQSTGGEVTWCSHPVGECGEEIQYVRADRVERLEALVDEMADEIEADVQNRYGLGGSNGVHRTPDALHHVERRRYERDMEIVHRARAALTETRAEGKG